MVDDDHFDPSYHLRYLSIPAPRTMRDLLDLVAAVFATPLDRQRPLWEAYSIDGVEAGKAAHFFKMHHSMVDGVGSVATLNALTHHQRKAEVPRVARPRSRRAAAGETAAPDAVGMALATAGELGKLAWRTATAPAQILADPAGSVEYLGRPARA